MFVEILGFNTANPSNKIINRPSGINYYLLSCFSSSFVASTVNGLENGNPGDCILYKTYEPQYISGVENAGFINDWIHFYSENNDVEDLLKKYQIPTSQIIPTNQSSFLTKPLISIYNEMIQKPPFYKNKINLHIEEIFINLSRAIKQKEKSDSFNDSSVQAFTDLRQKLIESYQENWTIEKMAKEVNLCESRFSVLYQHLFYTSPYSDLISIRLDHAKKLLITSDKTIGQIAQECGFSDSLYFSKVFKSKTQMSPSKYRIGLD